MEKSNMVRIFNLTWVNLAVCLAIIAAISVSFPWRVRVSENEKFLRQAAEDARNQAYKSGSVVVTDNRKGYIVVGIPPGPIEFFDGAESYKELPGKPVMVYGPRHQDYYEWHERIGRIESRR